MTSKTSIFEANGKEIGRNNDCINVAAYLPKMAQQHPDALAVAVATGKRSKGKACYKMLTFAELNNRCDRIAHGLWRIGIKQGTRTVVMVNPSVEFFALTFALLKIGAILVMVDPGMGVKNLGKCLSEAEPKAFIGIPKAHVARILFGWCKKRLTIKVTVGKRLFFGGYTLSHVMRGAPNKPYPIFKPPFEETAAILFTSGSTGVPKGVITPHHVFASQVRMLRDTFGIQPGEVDLSTFPLFALFGPALGMASVVPDMDASRPASANPRKIIEAFEDFSCTNMFASPALIEKLGRYCHKHSIKLKKLRRVISAGAPASIKAIERFQKVIPKGIEIFTPYGATESLPISVIGSKTILNETRHSTDKGGGVCVGLPVAGMNVEIIPIRDEPIKRWSNDLRLPPNTIGEIVVKGPVVTPGYYNRERSTRLAKIYEPDGTVHHRMGDVGYFDTQGRLWMCGRKDHRIETDKGTMFTIPCEAVFNANPNVFRSALVGVNKDGLIMPVLCVELEKGIKINKAALTAELLKIAKTYKHTRTIKTILFHPSFPVDVRHNAKIFREKLTLWAQEKLS
ncbi:MAG: fatty acid CoA ligase family protein [bacterium]